MEMMLNGEFCSVGITGASLHILKSIIYLPEVPKIMIFEIWITECRGIVELC